MFFTDFSCRNVQMILNASCKSGHVRLYCLKTFKSLLVFRHLITLTTLSALTALSISTSISNFKIQIQIRGQFCLMVCWRSWQHDTYFRGCEVGLWLSISEIKSNQHKFDNASPQGKWKLFDSKTFSLSNCT